LTREGPQIRRSLTAMPGGEWTRERNQLLFTACPFTEWAGRDQKVSIEIEGAKQMTFQKGDRVEMETSRLGMLRGTVLNILDDDRVSVAFDGFADVQPVWTELLTKVPVDTNGGTVLNLRVQMADKNAERAAATLQRMFETLLVTHPSAATIIGTPSIEIVRGA
jgi:hypothetical protein